MAQQNPQTEMHMDPAALYREESFTDRQVGSIQRLTPVKKDGSEDTSRQVVYVGQTQVLTPAGSLPLSFEIEGRSLEEAASNFGDAANKALEEAMQQLKELQRESASSLYVPGQGGGAGGGQGGLGGQGGFQMP